MTKEQIFADVEKVLAQVSNANLHEIEKSDKINKFVPPPAMITSTLRRTSSAAKAGSRS